MVHNCIQNISGAFLAEDGEASRKMELVQDVQTLDVV